MKRQKYDFILFENYHHAQHHKYDVVLIARMMKSQGLRVAILDIYGEDSEDRVEGIEIIHLPFKPYIPNDKWQLAPKNKVHSLVCKLRFLWEQHHYIKKIIKFIEPLANRFYCGSYHLLMSPLMMNMSKPVYFWGLRSRRMTTHLSRFKREPVEAIQSIRLKKTFLKNENNHLFVSNEIIRNEFLALGVSSERMVIREERCIDKQGSNSVDSLDKTMSFLVIGMLRKEKNLPLTVNAFKKADIPSSKLYLIGRSREKYEQVIEKAIEGDKRILRKNNYLEYDDFNAYFAKSHFVLFADEQGESCITNGTMTEALINHRPIICPDYNPYAYYINKYGVGLVYRPGDATNYATTLQQAAKLGTEYFLPYINHFLETITFEQVSQQLVRDLRVQN